VIVARRPQALEAPQHIPRHRARSGEPKPWLFLAIAAAEIAGVAALVKSALIAQTTVRDEAEFTWFWLGMIVAELPVIAMMARRVTSAAARSALLIVAGFVSYLPKLLRDPGGPVYHDEYAHWRATYNIVTSGRLFEPAQIIAVIGRYPGLHAATAVIAEITGLSLWQAATVLMVLCHIAMLLGVATLARSLGLGSRAATLGAVAYGFNASFLYFDTQFAYESLAITIVAWTLACYAQVIRARRGPHRRAWCFLTALLTLGCVVTHHLSTIDLAVIMAVMSAALSLPRAARADGWRGTAATAWGLTAFTGLAIGAWIFFVAPGTVAYLSPYPGNSLSQLLQMAAGSKPGRTLFSASVSPWWEQMAAFAAALVALAMTVAGGLRIRRCLRDGRLPPGSRRALLLSIAAVGAVYFPSIAFIFAPSGAEGARRSWGITWIGLAILAGPVAVWLADLAARRRRALTRNAVRFAGVAVAVVSLVGNTAAGLNAFYRFNGPFLFGSEARSQTAELTAMTQWFRHRFGDGNNIVTDLFTRQPLVTYGAQNAANASAGFPVWDLYSAPPGQPLGPESLIASLVTADYRYLVVDERMATDVPQLGLYFDNSEPSGLILPDGKPVFNGRLAKFDGVVWMSKVLESDNYAVYRMNLPPEREAMPYQARQVRFHGKLAVGR
jgi:hypothetical protein